MHKKTKYPCVNHPDRIGVVDRNGRYLCWQCYLPESDFNRRFGKDFYKKEIR